MTTEQILSPISISTIYMSGTSHKRRHYNTNYDTKYGLLDAIRSLMYSLQMFKNSCFVHHLASTFPMNIQTKTHVLKVTIILHRYRILIYRFENMYIFDMCHQAF